MRILGGKPQAASSGADDSAEISPFLLRAAARIEEIVVAARHAVEEIELEARRLASPEDSTPASEHERAVAELARTVVARAEQFRVGAEEVSRVLKRAALQLNWDATLPPPAEPPQQGARSRPAPLTPEPESGPDRQGLTGPTEAAG